MHANKTRPDYVPDYLQLLRLDGRSIIVLGGGGGIGRQAVHAVCQAGAQVVCIDRDEQLAGAVADEAGCQWLSADVTDRADLSKALNESERLIGPVNGVVDIVGAAAIGRLDGQDDDTWERQVAVNLRHAVLAIQLAAPRMEAAGGGSFAFVGSLSGVRAVALQSLYGAIKAALHQLILTMADELGPAGIRINGVAPGWTKTPRLVDRLSSEHWRAVDAQIPRGSAGDPSEIAAPLLFLMSNLASYVTGQVLLADGGFANAVRRLDVF